MFNEEEVRVGRRSQQRVNDTMEKVGEKRVKKDASKTALGFSLRVSG